MLGPRNGRSPALARGTAQFAIQTIHEPLTRAEQDARGRDAELAIRLDELRCAQLELRAARLRCEARLELASVGLLTVDPFGVILDANLVARRMLGIHPLHVERALLRDCLTTADAVLIDGVLRTPGGRAALEIAVAPVDGVRFRALLVLSPSVDAPGAIAAVLIDLRQLPRAPAARALAPR
ncbi:MAG: PAS domain-containing protein [Deltaproteobacteria bacterium]|nr:PAS domain-containing protein [Deltaproteobacteria bacterium]